MIKITISSAIKIILTICILFVIRYLISKLNALNKNIEIYDTENILINPVVVDTKTNCQAIRTTCDKNDPYSCSKSCNEEQLNCIDLDSLNPPNGSSINSGGTVCLPKIPEIKCNTKNGGIYVWTGYGSTDRQTWDCYCSKPEYFGGTGCETINADICSGGTVNLDKLNTNGGVINSEICNCPPGTIVMMRENVNTPFCASTDPSKGGGMYGLVGSIFKGPDWRNVLFRQNVEHTNNLQTIDDWADSISKEISNNYTPNNGIKNSITNILNTFERNKCNPVTTTPNQQSINTSSPNYCNSNKELILLTQDIADTICKNSNIGIKNTICNGNTAIWDSKITNATTKAFYTYFKHDYIP